MKRLFECHSLAGRRSNYVDTVCNTQLPLLLHITDSLFYLQPLWKRIIINRCKQIHRDHNISNATKTAATFTDVLHAYVCVCVCVCACVVHAVRLLCSLQIT